MKNLFVSQLSTEVQEAIQSDVINALNELQLDTEEQTEAIENAMNSRLSDLADLIDINKYL